MKIITDKRDEVFWVNDLLVHINKTKKGKSWEFYSGIMKTRTEGRIGFGPGSVHNATELFSTYSEGSKNGIELRFSLSNSPFYGGFLP